MIIILSLSLVLVIGIVLLRIENPKWETDLVGSMCITITSVVLIIVVIGLPISHMYTNAAIAKFKATETTVITARNNGVAVENTAIQHKIIESNQWLASKKYLNSTIFGLWISDKVEALNPIE